jgi:uncharacterized membrane protein YgdD (TMEM256/DUF423 family)
MAWVVAAAVLGSAAVLLGAFGAHGLDGRLTAEALASWRTAVQYHLAHAVALLALALFARASGRSVALPAALFTVGTLLFSGSIYLLVLGGPRWLGPVTPLGGLAFAGGWLALLALARS